LCVLVGALAGSASAFFLVALDVVKDLRMANFWLIAMLPLAGGLIGWVYYRYGTEVSRGNVLIVEEFHRPQKTIPFRMAPMVLFGTLATHLVGGSAGREGTAVQMGASMADQLTGIFKLSERERQILLICGVSAGFAS